MPYADPVKNSQAKREYYLKNTEDYRRRTREDRAKRRAYIAEFKNKPCMDCKMPYPSFVMDLDHREGEIKIENLAKMIARYSWNTILEELKKCDVVCSNCHRIRTHNRKMLP
jgi:hypothetical protein